MIGLNLILVFEGNSGHELSLEKEIKFEGF
jgi:hypothetical protein